MRWTVFGLCVAIVGTVAPWVLFLDLVILYQTHGLWSGVVGLVLAPITYLVVPWYAWIALDEWVPLVFGYGSMVVAIVLVRLWRALGKRRE